MISQPGAGCLKSGWEGGGTFQNATGALRLEGEGVGEVLRGGDQ